MRTVRRFVDEEERGAGKGSTAPRRPVSDSSVTKERHQEAAPAEETKPKAPVTYQMSEQPSARVQEEEFAKQLRLARYLAAGGLPPSRPLEPTSEARAPKDARSLTKARPKTKKETPKRKVGGGINKGEAPRWAGGSAEDALIRSASKRKGAAFARSLEARVGDSRESEQSRDAVSYWNDDTSSNHPVKIHEEP